MVFGDLFLDDVRAYREQLLAPTGITPLFPLWGRPTARLARQTLAAGAGAVLTCDDSKQLPGEFAGRTFDKQLLADLPAGIDPCGERGEFHTFVMTAQVSLSQSTSTSASSSSATASCSATSRLDPGTTTVARSTHNTATESQH